MEDLYRAIHSHSAFKQLERERARLGWSLTAAVLFVYFAFILVIAFKPALFATPITGDSTITWGIPIGLFVILFSFVLTGFYTHRANTRFDPAARAVIRDVHEKQAQAEQSL